jgi:hypothetical protein
MTMLITRMPRLPALAASAAAAALAAALLSGCGSGGNSAATTTAAQGNGEANGAPDANIEAIVRCYRAHGDASFPDPVYDPSDGRWHFGTSPGSAPLSTQQACQHLFPVGNASPPVPQPQFQQLVRLAECIRRHGVPNWPDPDPAGSFPLPPSLQTKTSAQVTAQAACRQYIPSGGLNVHAVP